MSKPMGLLTLRARKWAVIAATLLGAARAQAGQQFAWSDDGASAGMSITPSIFLSDDNVSAVDQFLATQSVKAVKIAQDVSPATIALLYNKYNVNYTFLDFESSDATSRVANVVSQIKSSSMTGPALSANQSYISNFGYHPIINDTTASGPAPGMADYFASGVNMSSEALYPGSPGFRNPANQNSTAPNIRSALFTLPVTRLSLATGQMPLGHAHIAYIDRFNNWGNASLDSDGDPSNGYRFVTQNQLLSRGDFQAQVLHYRLRGATNAIGLQGGIEGYTREQFQSDIDTGWSSLQPVNNVLSDPNARLASVDTHLTADGKSQTLEDVGVVFSGAYSLAQGRLVMLLSNLDEKAHDIAFPPKIGGKWVTDDFSIDPGTHELLQFAASGTHWDFLSETQVFMDNDRSGVGVPEPSLAALAAAGLAIGLARRRRVCA